MDANFDTMFAGATETSVRAGISKLRAIVEIVVSLTRGSEPGMRTESCGRVPRSAFSCSAGIGWIGVNPVAGKLGSSKPALRSGRAFSSQWAMPFIQTPMRELVELRLLDLGVRWLGEPSFFAQKTPDCGVVGDDAEGRRVEDGLSIAEIISSFGLFAISSSRGVIWIVFAAGTAFKTVPLAFFGLLLCAGALLLFSHRFCRSDISRGVRIAA